MIGFILCVYWIIYKCIIGLVGGHICLQCVCAWICACVLPASTLEIVCVALHTLCSQSTLEKAEPVSLCACVCACARVCVYEQVVRPPVTAGRARMLP